MVFVHIYDGTRGVLEDGNGVYVSMNGYLSSLRKGQNFEMLRLTMCWGFGYLERALGSRGVVPLDGAPPCDTPGITGSRAPLRARTSKFLCDRSGVPRVGGAENRHAARVGPATGMLCSSSPELGVTAESGLSSVRGAKLSCNRAINPTTLFFLNSRTEVSLQGNLYDGSTTQTNLEAR